MHRPQDVTGVLHINDNEVFIDLSAFFPVSTSCLICVWYSRLPPMALWNVAGLDIMPRRPWSVIHLCNSPPAPYHAKRWRSTPSCERQHQGYHPGIRLPQRLQHHAIGPTRRLLTKSPCYNGALLSPSLLALLYNEIHLTFRRLRQ